MKKVLQNFFGKALALVLLFCAFVIGSSAQITMSTSNCVVTANEIQMTINVTNNSAGDLRWNGAVVRFTVPAAIIPAGTHTYSFVYVGLSDFPSSFPAGPGVQAAGATYTAATRLLTWTSTPSGAYNNTSPPCAAPLILPGETKIIGRFSFKITTTPAQVFVPNATGAFVWAATSSCNLYQACAPTVTGYSTLALRTLAPPCSLTTPADCSTVTIAGSSTNVSCAGGSNGTATGIVTGGTAPFTYSIAPAGNTTGNATGAYTGLSAGTYTISFSDGGGCSGSTAPLVISEPTAVTGTESHTSIACFGQTSTVTITPAGGTGPYTYSLDGGTSQSSGVFSGVSGGAHSVTITDANSCTGVVPVSIASPTQVGGTATATTIACFGGSSTITVTPTGGTPPYMYSLNGGAFQSGNTFTVPAGGYSIVVRDANSCLSSAITGTIAEPAVLSATESHTPIACGGTSTVTITPAGGTAPYMYSLNGGTFQSSNVFTGVPAGNHVVTVRDANLCTTTVPVGVFAPSGPSATATQTPILCFGQTSTVTVSVTGGAAPYTYSLDGGPSQSSNVFATVAAGSHTITVSDFNGCTSSVSVNISTPSALNATGSNTPIACNGQSSTVTINATGGTVPYTYSLDGGTAQSSNTFAGVLAGSHSVLVSDGNGCTTTVPVNITQPPVLGVTASQVNVTCFGLTNGSISATATGGTTPYSYSIGGPGQASGSFTGLGANTYTVAVTDANGCTATVPVTISQPAALSAPVVSVTQPTCTTLGTITFTSPVPAAGITYSIDGVTYTNTTGVFTIPVAGGSFSASYRNGVCTSTSVPAVVNAQPATPPAPVIVATPIIPSPTPTYTLSITNLVPGASVLWSTGATTLTIVGDPLIQTTYTATQSNGTCTSAVGSITLANVTADPAIGGMLITSMTDVVQNTNTLLFPPTYRLKLPIYNLSQVQSLPNGTTTVTIDLGTKMVLNPSYNLATAPLSSYFTWSVDVTGRYITGNQIAVIPEDFADVAVFEVRGTLSCTSVIDANITATLTDEDLNNNDGLLSYTFPPTVSAVPTNITCNGLANGSIAVTSSPGTIITVYNSSLTIVGTTGLPPGVYTIVASSTGDGGNTCSASTSVTITQPSVLNATVTSTSITCFGGNNGTATVSASGGTPSYTYAWAPGTPWTAVPGAQTAATAVGLTAGVYSVKVTDANGCTKIVTVTVTQPATAISLATTGSGVSCFGSSNGSATVTATGGVPGYSYSWNTVPVQVGQTATNLAPGTYTVTVTDALGCSASITYTVSSPALLSATITGTNVTCNGLSNGSATITSVTGGTAPYSYAWSTTPVQTGSTATGLGVGTYVCVITDANGCTTSASYTVTQPTSLVLMPSHTNVSCFGGANGTITAVATGGTPSYTYSVNGIAGPFQASNVFTGLAAGTYILAVKDQNGCTQTASVVVTQPLAGITVAMTGVHVLCNGNNTGTATATPSGGTAPYTYVWNTVPVQNTQTATGLVAGVYNVVVTDANGCSAPGTYTITQPSALTATISGNTILCNGSNSGTVTAIATGGTAPITYVISGPTVNTTGASSGIFTGLTAGAYTVICTDANGCTRTVFFTITQPAAPLASGLTGLSGNACHFGNAGTMSAGATGGTPVYTYTISYGPANNPSSAVTGLFTGLPGGTYTITITDANGCQSFVTATVFAPAGLAPDLSLGSNYTSNFFFSNGVENRIVFNVSEIGGNPAVGDTIRITKVSGYDFFFDNTSVSQLVGSITYTLNNGQWKLDNTNPAFLSLIKIDPSNPSGPGTINCLQIEFVSLRMVRNTPNISTFTLSSRIRRANGEINLTNNLNSIIFTAE